MRISRLLGLLGVLTSGERVTVQALADRFEVSRRTIFRDLEALGEAGIPVVAYPGSGGGVGVMEGYLVGKALLTGEDAGRIAVGLGALASVDGDSEVLHLLARLVPDKGADQSPYALDLSAWFDDWPTKGKAERLKEAIRERRCVMLEYVGREGRSRRVVEPHRLVFRQDAWYLLAYCREREAFRLFRLRRIANMEALEEGFSVRSVDERTWRARFAGRRVYAQPHEGCAEVVLTYDAADEFALTRWIDAMFMRRCGERGEVRLYVRDIAWAAGLVMQTAGRTKAAAPPELVALVASEMKKLNEAAQR